MVNRQNMPEYENACKAGDKYGTIEGKCNFLMSPAHIKRKYFESLAFSQGGEGAQRFANQYWTSSCPKLQKERRTKTLAREAFRYRNGLTGGGGLSKTLNTKMSRKTHKATLMLFGGDMASKSSKNVQPMRLPLRLIAVATSAVVLGSMCLQRAMPVRKQKKVEVVRALLGGPGQIPRKNYNDDN